MKKLLGIMVLGLFLTAADTFLTFYFCCYV